MARKKTCIDPNCVIAPAQIAVRPAAGPLTLNSDLLISVTNKPPMIPAINPADAGAPDASATPRHKGRATKKTVMLARKS